MSELHNEVRLTQFSKGAGCGCKIAPDTLEQILSGQKTFTDPLLLVGNSTRDDAAVYDLEDERVLISTTDFFSPIVDDPYDFGRISATNALSDIYAMGGKPILALAILGWPLDKLDPSLASKVMDGAAQVCREAGIAIAGGHSIDVPEPIFGLAVNGIAKRANLKTNSGAREGDLLYLTKPLGVGILSTAMKRGVIEKEDGIIAISLMCQSNAIGAELALLDSVHAMTDVTGFGLIGHLLEMIEPNNLSANLFSDRIPVMQPVPHYIAKGCYPDGSFRNWRGYGSKVAGTTGNDMLIFSDPQTSGGLLIAVSENKQAEVEFHLKSAGLPAEPIGQLYLHGLSNSPRVTLLHS
jgi:selenide,water dikinase